MMMQPQSKRFATFTMSATGQEVTIFAQHVTDIAAAVQDIPRCRVRLTNGAEVILDHPAKDVVDRLFHSCT